MKTKILLLSFVSIFILGLAAGAFWWFSRPQIITFSDDAKLTLVKVEYGKRHAPPMAAKAAAGAARRREGKFVHHAQRRARAVGARAIRQQTVSLFPVFPL